MVIAVFWNFCGKIFYPFSYSISRWTVLVILRLNCVMYWMIVLIGFCRPFFLFSVSARLLVCAHSTSSLLLFLVLHLFAFLPCLSAELSQHEFVVLSPAEARSSPSTVHLVQRNKTERKAWWRGTAGKPGVLSMKPCVSGKILHEKGEIYSATFSQFPPSHAWPQDFTTNKSIPFSLFYFSEPD